MVELCIVGYLDGSDRVNNNKIISKILNIIMNILIFIFGIVLLISIYNIIQVNVLGNEKSSFFGYSLFEVQSGSMSPAIEKGDWMGSPWHSCRRAGPSVPRSPLRSG